MEDDLRAELRRDRLSSVFSTRRQGLLDHGLDFGHMTDAVAKLIHQRRAARSRCPVRRRLQPHGSGCRRAFRQFFRLFFPQERALHETAHDALAEIAALPARIAEAPHRIARRHIKTQWQRCQRLFRLHADDGGVGAVIAGEHFNDRQQHIVLRGRHEPAFFKIRRGSDDMRARCHSAIRSDGITTRQIEMPAITLRAEEIRAHSNVRHPRPLPALTGRERLGICRW